MILALDTAFRNVGIVVVEDMKPVRLDLIKTKSKTKKERKGKVALIDFQDAQYICQKLQSYNAELLIFENPVGSQTARASKLLGSIMGIMSSFPNTFPVTPNQVKDIVKKNAKKQEMIDWALNEYKGLNWKDFNKGDYEHLADALATFHVYKNNLS